MKTHLLLYSLGIFLLHSPVEADSGTWLTNPVDNNWNNPANWSSNKVPNAFNDTATFAVSSVTAVSLTASIANGAVVFPPGADAFTVTAAPGTNLNFQLEGIMNSSSATQNFVSAVDDAGRSGNYVFFGSFGETGPTVTGSVTFTQQARITSSGDTGFVQFQLGADAGDATFYDLGATTAGGIGGRTDFFYEHTSAAQATVINEGATVGGASGGATVFQINAPTAGSATLIANGGSNGGGGGTFTFYDASTGGSARVEVFGNGYLDISPRGGANGASMTIGSLEGDGQVYLGRQTLLVGSNDLSTTFSGVLYPGDPTGGHGKGAFTKVGTGTLTLTGANLYTAGTTVSVGTLVISNTTGSGTGTGAVSVNAGMLGGKGIIAGAVTIGTGSSAGAFLAPAHGTKQQATLTIQSSLTFKADSTYTCTFKAKRNKARNDKVVANGVTVNSDASFNFSGEVQGHLTPGLVLTAISNTSASPISGTFANLPDGAVLTVSGNNFLASYEGGDGNDLTLIVQ